MDYFQGVVIEYLRAKRSIFVNPQYLISLDEGKLKKGRHWYCDSVAVDLKEKSIYLCEITYSSNAYALISRLADWRSCWQEVADSIRRDSSVPSEWAVRPWIFIPRKYEEDFRSKFGRFSTPSDSAVQMPYPLITHLESTLPWEYLITWDRKIDHFAVEKNALTVAEPEKVPVNVTDLVDATVGRRV
ncbi:hypothetical protein [Thiocapsa marina]|uniref:Uncharacterized protein n=1 Tax=Thiocapsa marina 5811 TaxID=768671 RepID=F9UH48_9GAMM|nr:hypothetical protein [Thiocapsa marina]EGV16452.1 hypothetical protein ThimaDRAFT_4221 [Thiocapsa marina 5811]